MDSDPLNALGLMSGPSMDGIDAAVIRTDGETVLQFGPTLAVTYDEAFRQQLRAVVGDKPAGGSDAVERELTRRHAGAVRELLAQTKDGAWQPDVIGFHGHTVFHQPSAGITRQIGDSEWLARETGIPVVADFRSRDVAAGGGGAPLAPLFHSALAEKLEKPLAVLNLGGVANVTWIGENGTVWAFDTGPGNALIDDWVLRHTGSSMDKGGRLAQAGRVHEDALQQLMANPFFDWPTPKSLDRDHFDIGILAGISVEDGAATLSAFTAAAVARAAAFFPQPAKRWFVSGGGRHNPVLMGHISTAVDGPVASVESVGWDGDFIEAQAFGFLAVRSLRALPLSLPTTTGVHRPLSGGTLFLPDDS